MDAVLRLELPDEHLGVVASRQPVLVRLPEVGVENGLLDGRDEGVVGAVVGTRKPFRHLFVERLEARGRPLTNDGLGREHSN